LYNPDAMKKRQLTKAQKQRQADGIARAKAAGRMRGRLPGTTAAHPADARTLRAQGFSHSEIARKLGVSSKTVQRYLLPLDLRQLGKQLLRATNSELKKRVPAIVNVKVRRGRISEVSTELAAILLFAFESKGPVDRLPGFDDVVEILGQPLTKKAFNEWRQSNWPQLWSMVSRPTISGIHSSDLDPLA
jgi:transcriptional regulator with XRE-family HTH domain